METLEDFLELSQAVPPAVVTSTAHLAIIPQTFCWACFNLLSKAYPLCPGGPCHPPVCGITWRFGNQQYLNIRFVFIVIARENLLLFLILLETNSENVYDIDLKAELHSKPERRSLACEDLPFSPGCNISFVLSEFHKQLSSMTEGLIYSFTSSVSFLVTRSPPFVRIKYLEI